MIVINQSHKILNISHPDPLHFLEQAARTCYKSEGHITQGSAEKLIGVLIKSGHHSQLEHVTVTVKFITNRGVTHELVRHRIGMSYSQESTRYVKYNGNMEFIRPVWCKTKPDAAHITWLRSMMSAEAHYNELLGMGWRPEQAREVLPNSLKTEIVVTGNLRAWGHVFDLRCSLKAHPQMRDLMIKCRGEMRVKIPLVFETFML